MRLITLTAAAIGALSLGACASDMDGSAASAAASGSPVADTVPTSATAFVTEAARSDMYEIQSSQLAESKAASPAVRDFAAMMIRDHTNSTQVVMAAARSAGMNPAPPPLDARRAGLLSQLQGVSGADFDRLYLRQQLTAHQEALALHSGYAQSGDNAALRAAAAQIAPIVQQHLSQLQGLQAG